MRFQFPLQISAFLTASVVASITLTAFAQTPVTTPQVAATASYGKLPLSFEANQGQTDPSVQFLAHGQGYALFLRQSEAVFTLNGAMGGAKGGRADVSPETLKAGKLSVKVRAVEARATEERKADVVRMQLIGGNPQAAVAPEDRQISRSNYFLGSDPTRWRTDIPNYSRIRYSGVYPGIDLVYYGNQRQLEHDFVVAPNANPARIVLGMQGAKGVQIDAGTGDLIVTAGQSKMRLLKPVTYQETNGSRGLIPSSYKLLAGNRVGFTIGSYNHAQPLIIDPVLVYSTYLGGSGINGQGYPGAGDQGNGIAVDSSGGAYVVGTAFSTDFPVTGSAFQSTNNSALAGHGSTVFVAKLNAAGTALLYSTYLGGSGGDSGYGIALDAANHAYITGATHSTDFPVTCGAFQTTNPSTTANAPTTFVSALKADGSALLYSTYLGGSGNGATPALGDVAQAIAVDLSGNAYLTGYTASANFPTTTNAFQPHFAGSSQSSNAFVTKLNPTGTALVYSTYLGGAGSGDVGNAIAIDWSGNAYVAGNTGSVNFPVTTGAFQTSNHFTSNIAFYSGTAFVTKLNAAGSAETYSTYLGGSGGDVATGIAIDNAGFAYVAGNTGSADFPVTPGVVEGSSYGANAAYLNGFVTKLNPDGAGLAYSTHIEGRAVSVNGIAIDAAGAAYVVGSSPSTANGSFAGFQSTPGALTSSGTVATAAFLVKLSPSGNAFNYATLFGGYLDDGAVAVTTGIGGNVFVTGYVTSSIPTTANAYQGGNRNGYLSTNAFVSKFTLVSQASQTTYPSVPATLSTFGVVDTQFFYNFFSCGIAPPVGATVGARVYANQIGPALNGDLSITGNFDYDDVQPIFGNPPTNYGFAILNPGGGASMPGPDTLSFGDPVWGSWNLGIDPPIIACPTPPSAVAAAQTGSRLAAAPPYSNFKPGIRLSSPLAGAEVAKTMEAKFAPPPAVANSSSARALTSPQASPAACIAPPTLFPLTVTVLNAKRVYGAANPAFHYTVSGLQGRDTVTVSTWTRVTATSPAGSYPIGATVTGVNAAKYQVAVSPGTLTILKAPLAITAANVAVTYGQTPPPPTAYHLSGFVNGDSASVVTGAPVLTTTVTATTPVGFYPIGVQVGSLAAANYSFVTVSNSVGTVGVYKAPLTIRPDSFTIHVGDPLPAFTYTITGFVNSETQATATTGAAALTTAATSSAQPGRFYVIGNAGTLKAQNYYFMRPSPAVDGVLTILK